MVGLDIGDVDEDDEDDSGVDEVVRTGEEE